MPKKSTDTKVVSWTGILTSLVGVVVLGSFVAYFGHGFSDSTVRIFSKTSTLTVQELATLLILVGLTFSYLTYFMTKLSFSNRWLVSSSVFLSLILFVKFTLSNNELTEQASKSFGTMLATALLVGLLYIFAFALMYFFFDGKVLNRALHKTLITTTEGKVLLAMGLFICATVARIVIFRLPLLSGTNASSYLNDIFKSNSMLLSSLLFVMIIAAVEAYAQVRRRVDLIYFFVSGTVLILAIHLWWAIFVYRGFM